MRLDALELDRRTRETLMRLAQAGRSGALAAARDLVDLGYDARTAWALVQAALRTS